MCEVHLGASLRYLRVASVSQEPADQEQIVGAPRRLSWSWLAARWPWKHRLPKPHVGRQPGVDLVEADHRFLGAIGFGVQVQHILHMGHEVGTHLGNAPLLLLPQPAPYPIPGLEGTFLRWRRTALQDSDSTSPNSTTLSANARSIQ